LGGPDDQAPAAPVSPPVALPESAEEARASSAPPAAKTAPPEQPTGPGRAEAPAPAAWLPLPEVHDLPPIQDLLEPGTGSPPRDIPAQPSPARAEPHDATAWLPLPASEELPELLDLVAGGSPPAPTAATKTKPKRHHRRLRPHLPSRHTTGLLALFVLGAATIAALVYGATVVLDQGDDVTVRADGKTISVETGVGTVAALLEEQKIPLDDHDRVSPPASTPIENDMQVRVVRAVPLPVDFDGEPMTLYSTHEAPKQFVAEAARQLDVAPAAIALRDGPKTISASTEGLQLRTKKEGTLLVDGSAVNYESPSHTVAELLDDYKVLLQPSDFTSLGGDGGPIALDAVLPPSTDDQATSIEVVRVAGTTRTVDEVYSLDPQRLPDPELPVGETRIQEAAEGIMRRTYALELHDELEAGRTLVSEVPVKEAIPYVEFYGTKYNPLWDKMANCETGGNWAASGQRYQGGLGIYFQNWNHYGGRDFAPTAGQATKYEQIIVAERIREEHGWRAWGCAREIGL
jgi:uncharacterized protein YabE (DUF348 family)